MPVSTRKSRLVAEALSDDEDATGTPYKETSKMTNGTSKPKYVSKYGNNLNKKVTVEEAGGLMSYLMQKHLAFFAVWLLPISIVYDMFLFVQTRLNFWLRSLKTKKHEDKVADVQAQVRS